MQAFPDLGGRLLGTSGEEARLLARRLLTSAPAQRFASTPAGGAGKLAMHYSHRNKARYRQGGKPCR